MIEIARIFFLAAELKPNLPDFKLMRCLPPKYTELITSAAKNGVASGVANYEQLATLYEAGARFGIEPTEIEFRSLLTNMIREEIEKRDMQIEERLDLMDRLVRFYKQGTSYIAQVCRTFNSPPPLMSKFSTGFDPLDKVLGGSVVTGATTIVANPGTGKSYVSIAIASNWKHGSVWFYDPENGEGLMLTRTESIDRDESYDSKKLFFGFYNPEEILEKLRDDPDPGRLVIMDSLHFICGTGRTPDSGAKYERSYQAAIAMKQYCKKIIITTQVKRGGDGDSIDAGAASSCIERHSDAQIHLSKGLPLGDGTYEYRMFCSKNRNGVGGTEVKFAFDYDKAICRYIVEAPVFSEEAMETMEYI